MKQVLKMKSMDLEEIIEKFVNPYYEDNAKKLHMVVNKIFYRKYGGITGKDMSEFYSVANDVFTDIVMNRRYDSSEGDFDGFLYGALALGIIDRIKYQQRDRRCMKELERDEDGNLVLNEKGKPKFRVITEVYLDAPIGEGDLTLGDKLAGDFDIDKEVFVNEEIENSKIEKYLNRLSKRQRKIVELLAASYKAWEIQKMLHITQREYADAMTGIHSYRNISILF